MNKTKYALTSVALCLTVLLSGCGGPSCEERGGELKATFSHYQPVKVGNITIYNPVYIYTCEMPR